MKKIIIIIVTDTVILITAIAILSIIMYPYGPYMEKTFVHSKDPGFRFGLVRPSRGDPTQNTHTKIPARNPWSLGKGVGNL